MADETPGPAQREMQVVPVQPLGKAAHASLVTADPDGPIVVGDLTPASASRPDVSKSPTRLALERIRQDKVAMISLGVVIFFIVLGALAPVLAGIEHQSPTALQLDNIDVYQHPAVGFSATHWFGVEPRSGRDLFARWVYGTRPSLIVGFGCGLVTTIVGVVLGLLSGYVGGWVDRVISWVIDFTLSLPFLLFAIAVPVVVSLVVYGSNSTANPDQVSTTRFISLIVVLSLLGWSGLARLVRGQVLSLREREFVAAARVLGVSQRHIIFRELLPNLLAPIVVSASLAVPAFVITEAVLSILGVGLSLQTPSWGGLINSAQAWTKNDPFYLWLPVVSITLLVIALSLLGDAVRDAFDPKTR